MMLEWLLSVTDSASWLQALLWICTVHSRSKSAPHPTGRLHSTTYPHVKLIPYTTNNLEQVANLLCTQANSASYPQRDGKWVVTHPVWATGWRPSVAGWGGSVLLRRGSNCPSVQAMYGYIMCHSTISSGQSAVTSEIVKHCWSWVWLM